MSERTSYAVIDIGSNSLRLMTGRQTEAGQWHFSPKQLVTTRLGKDLERTHRLWQPGVTASLAALDQWQHLLGPMSVQAVATSAVREADDGRAFLAALRSRYGWSCRAIPGTEEAALSFSGATAHLAPDTAAGVLDIGGGSSELALGTQGQVQWSHSYPLGAVRLTTSEVVTPADVQAMQERCRHVLLPVPQRPDLLIGVGGTLTTLAAMDLKLFVYDPAVVEGHCVSRNTIAAWITTLQRLTPAERQHVPGLQPKRSDIIIAGLVIAWTVLDFYGIEQITVSERDLMEGVFYQQAQGRPAR